MLTLVIIFTQLHARQKNHSGFYLLRPAFQRRLSIHISGGGYPHLADGGYPILLDGGGGGDTANLPNGSRGTPILPDMEVPPSFWPGIPPVVTWDGRVLHPSQVRIRKGVPQSQVRMGENTTIPGQDGVPPIQVRSQVRRGVPQTVTAQHVLDWVLHDCCITLSKTLSKHLCDLKDIGKYILSFKMVVCEKIIWK